MWLWINLLSSPTVDAVTPNLEFCPKSLKRWASQLISFYVVKNRWVESTIHDEHSTSPSIFEDVIARYVPCWKQLFTIPWNSTWHISNPGKSPLGAPSCASSQGCPRRSVRSEWHQTGILVERGVEFQLSLWRSFIKIHHLAMGQNQTYPCSSHQNSWDLWMFIHPPSHMVP